MASRDLTSLFLERRAAAIRKRPAGGAVGHDRGEFPSSWAVCFLYLLLSSLMKINHS